MEVTRKGFVSSIAAALVASAVGSPTFAAGKKPVPTGEADKYTALIGTQFEFLGSDNVRKFLVLRDVVKRASVNRTEQFSLYFGTFKDGALAEGTYRVGHAQLGSMEMYLVPGGEKAALRGDFALVVS